MMKEFLKQGKIPHKFAQRLQVALDRVHGMSTSDISQLLGIATVTVSRYVKRFNEGCVHALLTDKTRKPGNKPVSSAVKNEITRIVCQERPKTATHWSTRELAKRAGISHNAVSQILRERELKPHQVKGFQLSNDPQFSEKLEDLVGLYLDLPDKSIVLSGDTMKLGG